MHSFAPAGHVVPSEAGGYEHALLLQVVPVPLTWHVPGLVHLLLQPPQLLMSPLAVFVSHPFAFFPSQSA